jgi:hypothetical protein
LLRGDRQYDDAQPVTSWGRDFNPQHFDRAPLTVALAVN